VRRGSLHWPGGRTPVRIVDSFGEALALLTAERDENTCRKDFTLTEAHAMGKALEAMERPKAKERKKRPGFACAEKFSGQEPIGRTLDKVGEAIGMSRITYQRVDAIVNAAPRTTALSRQRAALGLCSVGPPS
jgi:hypothetical protein